MRYSGGNVVNGQAHERSYDAPMLDKAVDNGQRGLRAYREPYPLGLAQYGSVDPYNLAAQIHQRAAAVAVVDRGVGLDHVVERFSRSVLMVRPRALMIPSVTVGPPLRANALPRATTQSPTRISSGVAPLHQPEAARQALS